MKVNKVLARLAAAPEDQQELRRVARALGNELPRGRLDVLRSFRALLARIPMPGATFAAGYVAALLDITVEYEAHVREVADQQELTRLAVSEGWREVLAVLRHGAKLPSELSAALGKDRPSVTRILKRLRTAGLVQSFAGDTLDGRMRPHRVTVDGRRLMERLDMAGTPGASLSGELQRGISVAVGLFRQLMTHGASPSSTLDEVAKTVLGDPVTATAAVSSWAEKSSDAGIIITEPDEASGLSHYRLTSDCTPVSGRNEALWHQAPSLLTQLKEHKREQVPVYVRTSDASFGAWAYALPSQDTTGLSRAIVNGDILSSALPPPDRGFDLVYDDPATIQADREDPTMCAFMERADAKFVVAAADEDVPEGFIQLRLATERE